MLQKYIKIHRDWSYSIAGKFLMQFRTKLHATCEFANEMTQKLHRADSTDVRITLLNDKLKLTSYSGLRKAPCFILFFQNRLSYNLYLFNWFLRVLQKCVDKTDCVWLRRWEYYAASIKQTQAKFFYQKITITAKAKLWNTKTHRYLALTVYD